MSTLLRTEGLGRRFGKRWAVRELQLHVREGDLYGFLGLNGAGKTTTLRMILGLVRPTSGRVFLFDKPLHPKLFRDVGCLVEAPAIHPHLTAAENLELLARLSGPTDRPAIHRMIERLGLGDRLYDRARHLSLGLRQRLGIAMALFGRPRFVILDEPSNGLDPRGIHDVRDLILELNREEGTTFLISSHLLPEVERLCTRVGIMRDGRLVVEEETRALIESRGHFLKVDAAPLELALETVSKLPGVGHAERVDGALQVRLGDAGPGDVNRALVEAGVDVRGLSMIQASLEDFFLAD